MFSRLTLGCLQFPREVTPVTLYLHPQRFPAVFPVQTPARSDFGKLSQDRTGIQSKELLKGPVMKLTWSFPSLPEEPQQPDIPCELRYPVPANSEVAQCAENSVCGGDGRLLWDWTTTNAL